MAIHVGFTGTRKGMTLLQKARLSDFLTELREADPYTRIVFHHGDCVGADAQAHAIASLMNLYIVIHPPDNSSARAFCRGLRTRVVEPAPYLARNRHIVDETRFLVAAPAGPETVRSGTWSTVRYAEKLGHRPILILPY